MGWTSFNFNGTKKDFLNDFCKRNELDIIKSNIYGKEIYAAVNKRGEKDVWGLIILTNTNNKDYYNFSYKEMDETVGPFHFNASKAVLNALTPIDSEYANDWRKKCKQRLEVKKILKPNDILVFKKELLFTNGIKTNKFIWTGKKGLFLTYDKKSPVKITHWIEYEFEILKRDAV